MAPRKKKDAQTIELNGKMLVCNVCGNDLFTSRRAQLNTAAASLFDLDWANKSANCYVCSKCTHIMWFLS